MPFWIIFTGFITAAFFFLRFFLSILVERFKVVYPFASSDFVMLMSLNFICWFPRLSTFDTKFRMFDWVCSMLLSESSSEVKSSESSSFCVVMLLSFLSRCTFFLLVLNKLFRNYAFLRNYSFCFWHTEGSDCLFGNQSWISAVVSSRPSGCEVIRSNNSVLTGRDLSIKLSGILIL